VCLLSRLTVICLFLFTSAVLAEPQDGDGAFTLGVGTKLKLNEDLNVPANVDIIYFERGTVYKTTWDLNASGTFAHDNYFKTPATCSFDFRSLPGELVGRAPYVRVVPAGTEIEITDVEYRVFPDRYDDGSPREDRDAYIWFTLGNSQIFEQFVCLVNGPSPGVPASLMTIGEMKSHIAPLLSILPARPVVTK